MYLEASSPVLVRCTIAGNWGKYASSGIHSKAGSAPVLRDCRILETGRTTAGRGFVGGSSPTLINCVLAGNRADYGGGAYCTAMSSLTLINCAPRGQRAVEGAVLCGRSGASGPSGTRSSGATDGASVGGVATNCLVDRDPLFQDIGSYDFDRKGSLEIGGSLLDLPDFVLREPDLHLRAGSTAIDDGTEDGAPEEDLDGLYRPCGAGIDIGPYEFCSSIRGRFRRGDANGDGAVDLSDAIHILFHLFLRSAGRPRLLPERRRERR